MRAGVNSTVRREWASAQFCRDRRIEYDATISSAVIDRRELYCTARRRVPATMRGRTGGADGIRVTPRGVTSNFASR